MAFAPIVVAFSTSRSSAWRRASSSRRVYSWISPPTMVRKPAMMLPPRPRLHDDPETLSERPDGAVAGDGFRCGDDHANPLCPDEIRTPNLTNSCIGDDEDALGPAPPRVAMLY